MARTLKNKMKKNMEKKQMMGYVETNGNTITVHNPKDWDIYKEQADGMYYDQKGATPEMTELHEGIEDLSAYYNSVGINRCEAADYIASTLFNILKYETANEEGTDKEYTQYCFENLNNIKFPILNELNDKKFKKLFLKCTDIVRDNKQAAFHYFD
jgi:hypothetical protein